MYVGAYASFLQIIEESQTVDVLDSPIIFLTLKNKKKKETLWRWNTKEVGNIFRKSELLQAKIEYLQTKEVDVGIFPEESALMLTISNLQKVLHFQNLMWKQKS